MSTIIDAATSIARRIPHLGRLGRAQRWRRTRGRPRLWAHRGDSAHAPENTMLAFSRAVERGADGIELDVQLDGDGHVVVFHDYRLERLTGTYGALSTLSASDRGRLRVGGEPIPLLADVLHAIDLEINVEIKANRPGRMGALVDATAKLIRDARRRERILVSSFDPAVMWQMHQALPEIAVAFLFHEQQSRWFRRGLVGRVTGASVVHPQHSLCTAETVATWHRAGLPINTWTVDDPDELARLIALGVDGVFCNDVAAARALIG